MCSRIKRLSSFFHIHLKTDNTDTGKQSQYGEPLHQILFSFQNNHGEYGGKQNSHLVNHLDYGDKKVFCDNLPQKKRNPDGKRQHRQCCFARCTTGWAKLLSRCPKCFPTLWRTAFEVHFKMELENLKINFWCEFAKTFGGILIFVCFITRIKFENYRANC